MDVNDRLRRMLEERGWSYYRLAQNAGLADSTVANIMRRNTVPSITTLEALCRGFGITLAQFFSDGEEVQLTDDLRALFNEWVYLTPEQKSSLLQLLKSMHQ